MKNVKHFSYYNCCHSSETKRVERDQLGILLQSTF